MKKITDNLRPVALSISLSCLLILSNACREGKVAMTHPPASSFYDDLMSAEFIYVSPLGEKREQKLLVQDDETVVMLQDALASAAVEWETFENGDVFEIAKDEVIMLHYAGGKASRELIVAAPEYWIWIEENEFVSAYLRGGELSHAYEKLREQLGTQERPSSPSDD